MNQDPPKCLRCQAAAPDRGVECGPCSYVSIVMGIVHAHWTLDELKALMDSLAATSIFAYRKTAKDNGATLCRKLGDAIIALAHPAGVAPDELKRRVCDALFRYQSEIRKIQRHEQHPGQYIEKMREVVAAWQEAASKPAA